MYTESASKNAGQPTKQFAPGLGKSAVDASNSRDMPESHSHTERLFACLTELQQLTGRVGNIAERVVGPTPACETAGDGPTPSSLSDRLNFCVGNFGRQLGQLRQEIERIERFV